MNAMAPLRIVPVAQGSSDRRRIGVLLDYFLQQQSPDQSMALDDLRQIQGLGGEPYLKTTTIPRLAKERGLGLRFSSGGPNKGDGGMLRKLHQLLQKEKLLTPETTIVWARDEDGDSARREDAEAARAEIQMPVLLLFAIAAECGEAWSIAGWEPRTPADQAKLKKWRRALGFVPQAHPARLSHKPDVPKSAKAVAHDLFDDDDEREAAALIAAVESNSQASVECGLQAFHVEIMAWLSRGG